jgi:uncharacterized Zn-finger protein
VLQVKLEPQSDASLCEIEVTRSMECTPDLSESVQGVDDTREFIGSESPTCLVHGKYPHPTSTTTKTELVQVAIKVKDFTLPRLHDPALMFGTDLHPTSDTTDIGRSVVELADPNVSRDAKQITKDNDQQYVCNTIKNVVITKPVTQTLCTKNRNIDDIKVQSGDKPYTCDTCAKSFARNSNLVQHMRVHTGDKPYQCEKCMKSFAGKSNLAKHMKVHTGHKPYKCDKCMKSFASKSHIVSHMKVHTGDKPYKCDTCMKSYSLKHHLVYHIKKTHLMKR